MFLPQIFSDKEVSGLILDLIHGPYNSPEECASCRGGMVLKSRRGKKRDSDRYGDKERQIW